MRNVSFIKFKRLNIFIIIILFSINIVGCSSVKNAFSNNVTKQKSVSEQITESTIITFPDKNLEKTIREELQRPTGDILMGDVNKITNLKNTKDKHIKNLSGIENFINLSSLSLSNNQISNIKPLEGLTKLTNLDLSSNKISNIDSLEGLTKLTSLNLYANKIKDYSPVYAYYKNLKSTDIASEVIMPKQKTTNIIAKFAVNTVITPKEEAANISVQEAVSTVITPKQKRANINKQVAVSTVVNPKDEPKNVIDSIAESTIITYPDENSEKLVINTIQPPTENILKGDANKVTTLENTEDKSITNLSEIENLTDLASLDLNTNQIKNYSTVRTFYKTLKSTDIVSAIVTPKQEVANVYDQVTESTVITPKQETLNVSDQVAENTVVTLKPEPTNLTDQVAENTVVTLKPEPTNLTDQVAENRVVTLKPEPTNLSNQVAKSTVITFPDKNLEKLVRDTIQHPTGDILKSDVDKIATLLNAEDKNITNLSGMENFTNLTMLNVSMNQIKATDIQLLQSALPKCDVN